MNILGCSTFLPLLSSLGRFFSTFSVFVLVLISTPVWAQTRGQTPPGPLPQATVTPLLSDAPAPWGIDPAALAGARISDTIKGNGFIQETVDLQNGSSFFFQSISSTDFSVDSYVKRTTGANNDPTGNVIFNQVLKDPAWGLTDHSFINGFKQPIQLHFDIVESKVATLGGTAFNQMDMFFRQQPFLDTATGQVRIRQDIGVWVTSFKGLGPFDVTENHSWAPTTREISHVLATSIPGTRSGDGGGRGPIDFWNDLTVVKIKDPVTNQLVSFSKCNDFGDPSGRGDDFEFASDRGSRGGCSASGSTSSARPAIPNHDLDSFQLTPIWWDRWGGAGNGVLSSGMNLKFPSTSSRSGN